MFRTLFTILFSMMGIAMAFAQESENVAEKLAEAQLEAYNQRDLEAFIEPYAEDVKIYIFPNTLLYEGREEMKNTYGRMFSRTPDLHCKLVNRIVMGNTVIDHEEVTRKKGDKPMEAIAIYKVRNGKIAEVYFIYGD